MSATVFEADEVMAAPRPRFARVTGRAYSVPAYERYKEKLAWLYRQAGGEYHGERPVAVTIDVMRRLPASRPKRVASEPDTVKPDVDNIAKAVLDALNGVAYRDDSQVVSLSVLKCSRMRGVPERLRVRVAPYDEGGA